MEKSGLKLKTSVDTETKEEIAGALEVVQISENGTAIYPYEEKGIKEKKGDSFYVIAKRVIDIFGAFFGLVILSPLLLGVAIAIKAESKGPVIFKQERVGKNNKTFKMYKFRSMVKNAEDLKAGLKDQNEMSGPMFKIKDDPRVTRVGKFIRKTSIDELPQLLNILKGEMSIVGPRPSLPKEVAEFQPWMMKRLEVPQGLTCYWQICGRNNIDFEEWMAMDVKYAREKSLKTDIGLIFRTVRVLFGDKNAC